LYVGVLMVKHVLLDWFGTLCDPEIMNERYPLVLSSILKEWFGGSLDSWLRAERLTYKWYEKYWFSRIGRGDFLKAFRETQILWVKRLFNLAGVDPSLTDDEYFQLSQRLDYEVTSKIHAIYPDVKKCLEELKNLNVRLYLSTGNSSASVLGALKASGIVSYFDGIFTSELFNAWKGSRKFWLSITEALRDKSSSCIIVDDELSVLSAAKELGYVCVLIDRRRSVSNVGDKVDFIIFELDYLLPIVEAFKGIMR